MKLYQYGLFCLLFSVVSISHANSIQKYLSQENKNIRVELKKDDVLLVNYNIQRSPIFRYSQWYDYVMECTSAGTGESRIEYPDNGVKTVKSLDVLLSYGKDIEVIGSNIDEQGVFTIKSDASAEINCTLHNKFGL
jgi:hypothetical protein